VHGRKHTLLGRCNTGSFIIVVFIMFIWALLAAVVGRFAEKKGQSASLWNIISVICTPLIGFLFVALLPSTSELVPRAFRRCPHCLQTVKANIDVCPYGHSEMSEELCVRKAA
jgi:hypothetical protein